MLEIEINIFFIIKWDFAVIAFIQSSNEKLTFSKHNSHREKLFLYIGFRVTKYSDYSFISFNLYGYHAFYRIIS